MSDKQVARRRWSGRTIRRHGRKCRHENCKVPRNIHGEELECPSVPGQHFLGHVPRSGASASFSEGEVVVAAEILTRLPGGGDCSVLIRSKDFAGFARKVQAMKATALERRAQEEETDGTSNGDRKS